MRCFAGQEQFDAFLSATRVLVCLLPLTPETEDIMNARTLSRLMPGGYVINVARGAHLVDEDLIALLDSGHLAGATLDVFRTEPLPDGHPFWRHPKSPSRPTLRPARCARRASRRSRARSSPWSGESPSPVWLTGKEDTEAMKLPAKSNSSTSARATACRTKKSRCRPRSRSAWCTACRMRA